MHISYYERKKSVKVSNHFLRSNCISIQGKVKFLKIIWKFWSLEKFSIIFIFNTLHWKVKLRNFVLLEHVQRIILTLWPKDPELNFAKCSTIIFSRWFFFMMSSHLDSNNWLHMGSTCYSDFAIYHFLPMLLRISIT